MLFSNAQALGSAEVHSSVLAPSDLTPILVGTTPVATWMAEHMNQQADKLGDEPVRLSIRLCLEPPQKSTKPKDKSATEKREEAIKNGELPPYVTDPVTEANMHRGQIDEIRRKPEQD